MKRQAAGELASAINRQAHMMAAQSFAGIRMDLEEMARAMLKHGAGLEEVLAAVRGAGAQLHDGKGGQHGAT